MIFKIFIVALVTAWLSTGCVTNAPEVIHPYLRVDPGMTALLEFDAWHMNPQPGDRYAIAGPDLEWRDTVAIGPADDRSGRCTMRESGDVEIVAPRTPGHWPCLMRVCRDGCMVGRLVVVSEPLEAESAP